MSKELISEAKLDNFEGPLTGSARIALHKMLDFMRFRNGTIFKNAGKKVRNHVGQFRPKTSDNYIWFWAHSFRVKSGIIAVLIPWAQDWDKKDGSLFDRSVAIYVKGPVKKSEIIKTLKKFTKAVKKAYIEYCEVHERPQ